MTEPQGQKPAGSSSGEWKDLFRQIESQVRREAARIVGVSQDSA